MIEIVAIDTPSLGDRTYLATDGTSAPDRAAEAGLANRPARARDRRGAPAAG